MSTAKPDDGPGAAVAELVGVPVDQLRPLGGGGFGRPYRGRLVDGREVFIKAGPPAPGAFALEAAGLRRLAAVPDGAAAAAVVAADEDLLVLEWVDQRPATPAAAVDFGRRLAITHRDGDAGGFGTPSDALIASEVLPAGSAHDTWPDFYREARLLPFIDRAAAKGHLGDDDRRRLQEVADALPRLAGPDEPPALVHGDLWSGNVLWTSDTAVLIDPACHGGHRETDLAMLDLFGLPHLDIVLSGYDREYPLAPGWRHRVALHQLFPLLVHAVIFGGSYGSAAGDTARRLLG